jgi:hypothetical protein
MDTFCKFCGFKLRPFKVTQDWNKRGLHKACWKIERDNFILSIVSEKNV